MVPGFDAIPTGPVRTDRAKVAVLQVRPPSDHGWAEGRRGDDAATIQQGEVVPRGDPPVREIADHELFEMCRRIPVNRDLGDGGWHEPVRSCENHVRAIG